MKDMLKVLGDKNVTATVNHPQGRYQNESSPNAKDGTIIKAEMLMEMFSLVQTLIEDQGLNINDQEEYGKGGTAANHQMYELFENFVRPIGMVFIEYPHVAPLPLDYPRLVFNNISSIYNGAFFRADSGSAATYGTVQLDSIRGHQHRVYHSTGVINYPLDGSTDREGSFTVWKPRDTSLASYSNNTGKNIGYTLETRPKNYAVRIYRKTGISTLW